MGLKCRSCQDNNYDIDFETLSSKSEKSNQNSKSILQFKKEQKSFNNIFKTKLPEFGEYDRGNFNKLIPERIRNIITENINSIRFTFSTRRTF